MNQLGVGNNIALRLAMLDCENVGDLRTVGEQHECFEDTLPSALNKREPSSAVNPYK